MINSRLDLFTAAFLKKKATFLPKLQVYFAEFLSRESLEHLRILSSTTCVGFGTGCIYLKLRGFSWKSLPYTIHLPKGLWYYHNLAKLTDLPINFIPNYFNVHFRQHAVVLLLLPPIAINASSVILNAYPSTTPFDFALGPD